MWQEALPRLRHWWTSRGTVGSLAQVGLWLLILTVFMALIEPNRPGRPVQVPGVAGRFLLENENGDATGAFGIQSVYYDSNGVVGLIFQGHGGSAPQISSVGEDVITLRYCGAHPDLMVPTFAEMPNAPPPEGDRVLKLRLINHGPMC